MLFQRESQNGTKFDGGEDSYGKKMTSLPNEHRKASLTPRLVDNVECKLTGTIFYLNRQTKEIRPQHVLMKGNRPPHTLPCLKPQGDWEFQRKSC